MNTIRELWAVWFTIALVILAALVVAGVNYAYSNEMTLIETHELSCNARLDYFDTDGQPENGAEVLSVTRDGDKVPLAALQFAPGDGGRFLRAEVRIPGQPAENYSQLSVFAEKYPHPCDVVSAAGIKF